ncbi:Putative queosine precursor transporter [Desulfonema limicola]|uniref:Probable queuosine precursor transporter n=1 Tax=Desulfonema limicola TaxID=45656 RepID=A0A975B6W1_9BACT|nr:queuosine precursor transporter [Desulfonema limicola]QTA79898.1 Putative queosine precursor transporter [Desulfonema limicola]
MNKNQVISVKANECLQEDKAFIILISIFIGSITISSILATKIISMAGFFVPAGVLAYSITFICTDVISEIWGKKRAGNTVIGGFIALLSVLILVQMSLAWPKAPFWNHEEAYRTILASTSRIIIASFAAYTISQFHDVWAFHFLKKLTSGHHLWLRNSLSTAVSQFLDSFIFITIAFYGVMPVWPLITGQWFIKVSIALLDTPFIYLIVWAIRRQKTSEKKENNYEQSCI